MRPTFLQGPAWAGAKPLVWQRVIAPETDGRLAHSGRRAAAEFSAGLPIPPCIKEDLKNEEKNICFGC